MTAGTLRARSVPGVGERVAGDGVGGLLREWRQRRRLSQLDFSLQAGISSRHLSFVETGRSVPSRDMVLHLAEELQVPLRERNRLLLAAGYAPVFSEGSMGSPELQTCFLDNITKITRSGQKVWVIGGETNEFDGADATWDNQHGIDVLTDFPSDIESLTLPV